MDRRNFLKWQLGGLALASIGSTAFAATKINQKTEEIITKPNIVVVKGEVAKATRKAVDSLGGMKNFVKVGQKVVIKPNMSFARGVETATNTHPEAVKEVVIMCQEAGASSILVLDHSLQNPQSALQMSGILDACNSVIPNICQHLMNESSYLDEYIVGALEMKSNAFMRAVLEADVIIAVPVAKSHSGAGVSLSLKGQMGLIYNRRSMHSQYSLSTSIVDLNLKIKPDLAIIDASRVLTSGGPSGPGLVITPNEIIASADPVAADAYAVASYEWYGKKIEPRQVKHILEAHDRGIGNMDIAKQKILRLSV